VPLYRRSETTAGTYLLEPRRTVVTGAGLFHTVIRAVSAQNISRHANAHYRPASSDRVRDHRMLHLLPPAVTAYCVLWLIELSFKPSDDSQRQADRTPFRMLPKT
jgi:hypothetical protein